MSQNAKPRNLLWDYVIVAGIKEFLSSLVNRNTVSFSADWKVVFGYSSHLNLIWNLNLSGGYHPFAKLRHAGKYGNMYSLSTFPFGFGFIIVGTACLCITKSHYTDSAERSPMCSVTSVASKKKTDLGGEFGEWLWGYRQKFLLT